MTVTRIEFISVSLSSSSLFKSGREKNRCSIEPTFSFPGLIEERESIEEEVSDHKITVVFY